MTELPDCGIALGVGKSSLMGEMIPGFDVGACGAARRIDTWGLSSITVLRRDIRRSLFDATGAAGGSEVLLIFEGGVQFLR